MLPTRLTLLFLLYFSDVFHTNYLNIHRADLYEICSDGRSLAVDKQSEIIFSIHEGTLP